MDYYQDIQVNKDPEFTEPLLMSVLLSKLHRGLVSLAREDIGISFPRYGKTLGSLLRLHGSQAALQQLQANHWLQGFEDYCRPQPVSAIPDKVQWRTVSRYQPKSNLARLLRRSVRYGRLTEQQAEQRLAEGQDKVCHLPYAAMRSQSTGQHFRLFIQLGPLQPHAVAGSFSGYGLSNQATIPWF